MDKKRMTVQELADAIHQGLDVSDDDMSVLFDDAPEPQAQPSPGPQGQTVQPTAPNTQAPTETGTPPAPAPTTGQPNELLNILPEKFRGDDPKSGVTKLAQSYGEAEAELARNRQELSQLKDYVQRMLHGQQPQQQPTQPQANPQQPGLPELPELPKQDGEEDDITFLEKPRAESRKEALRVLMTEGPKVIAHMLNRYDTIKTRQMIVDEFKRTHPDFDLYREELMVVFRENPWLDQDITMLPRAYEMAKEKFAAKQRGSVSPTVTTPNPQPTAPQSAVDIEKLKAEIKAELLEGIRKRKSAQGVTGGSAPVVPQQRVVENPRQQPATEEDKIWDAMVNSGPASMKL